MDCAACHNPGGWTSIVEPMLFDHDTTGFALEGQHAFIECKMCHSTMVFSDTPTDCIACHTDIHSQSVGNDCARCHSPESWLVDHIPELHEENGFPLIASHGGLSCVDCHMSETNMRFDRLGNDCISCHESDFMAAQTPNHVENGFSTNCIDCHDPLGFGWETELVDHNFFPLVDGHEPPSCSECHVTDNFADASPECISCHQDDYDSTIDPDHVQSGFPTNCAVCHSLGPGWSPAVFDHEITEFPLMGGHIGVDCLECHADGYTGTPTECVACHLDDFNNTTDPDHETSGFSTDCTQCHAEEAWEPAQFDHDNTDFPLMGGHVGVDCLQCHAEGYTGTPTECVACHLDDFNNTNDPDHEASGFPTDCAQCHNETAWESATFNHDQDFPIYSGEHQGEWDQCVDCHPNPNDFMLFTCITCHGEARTAEQHDPDDAPDYIWESNACLECHPDGSE